jgi:hypothetical protein
VALLTGSKNALKGLGFFLGGLLLSLFGYEQSLYMLAIGLGGITLVVATQLTRALEAKSFKPKFSQVFSSSRKVNLLSFARCFLFASRDVWFVVALPVFLTMQAGWSSTEVGTMMAAWVIIYGFFQSGTPKALKLVNKQANAHTAFWSAMVLALVLVAMLAAVYFGIALTTIAIVGLMLFAVVFAINSAVHSYLIVHFARDEGASMDVGLYYMANACGRLFGTVLSGVLFQQFGLLACIIASLVCVVICLPITAQLKPNN